MSNIKSKILAAAGAVTLIAGLAGLTAGTASASSAGCAFTNGCATLQGVDAASHAVAMDAKRQSAATGTLIIGYPDKPTDPATNFDAVLHFTSGAQVTTYADTALQASHLHFACTVSDLVKPSVSGTSTVVDGGNQMTVENDGGADFTSTSGTTLGFAGSIGVTTAILETASPGCTVLYTGSSFAFTWPADAGVITESYIGGGVTQFSDSNSSAGGKFTFDTLPAGVSATADSQHGDLNALSSTAVPGTYSSVGATYTEADGTQITEAFELVVSGTQSVNPGPDIPFYTFVYAKNGVWSSQCVTDSNGSGALTLIPCTLGKNRYQDFFALNGSGTPSDALTGGGQFHVQDWLASIVNGASSCLTDPSSLSPGTPQTDATDEAASPAGRQLRVDGSCSATGNLWTWAS